jgi:anti-sigma factor RsiW
VRRRVWRKEGGGIATVTPACALVREAISAALDGEEPPVEAGSVERHLAHCQTCRDFGTRVVALSELVGDLTRSAAPPPEALGRVSAACRRGGSDADATGLAARLGAPLPGRALPWPALAMGVGIVLPSVTLAALAHFHGASAHVHTPCSVLLHQALRQ